MSNKTRAEEYAGGFSESIGASGNLNDPRTWLIKGHYFGEIIFIAHAAIIYQCECFEDMARFAEAQKAWL